MVNSKYVEFKKPLSDIKKRKHHVGQQKVK